MEAPSQAAQGSQMPLYVRVKRRRDEPPPPFLCVLRPQKRQQMPDGARSEKSVLERALIFKHVDAASPPVPRPVFFGSQLPTQEPSDELQQPRMPKRSTAYRTQKRLTGGSAPANNQGSTGDAGNLAATEERTTFWNAFNTPLRQDVFGSFADTTTAQSARLEYPDIVEEAVKSLRRFRVDKQQQGGGVSSHSNAQQTDVLLHAGSAVQVLDVCPDGHTATSLSDEQAASHEFEYDLYAIECDSGESYPWERPRVDTHKQRLLELLQQDASAVALVEVEDVDQETGVVTRGKGSMQVFLEEFGDIDDSDSDEEGEIDYPSGESSDDRERCRPRRLWDSALSGSDSGSGRSSQSEAQEDFDDDDF